MSPLRKNSSTAIKAGVSLALLFVAIAASAAPIGTVTDLDGNLLVSRANGSVKVLAVGSTIEEGDILTSRKETYAALKLADESFVTIGPDTGLKLQRYVFDKQTPHGDGALFALAKGSVHITAGLLGTRSGDTFELATPTATIDVHGASVVVKYVAPDRAELAWRDTGPRVYQGASMVAVSYSPAADAGVRLAQAAVPTLVPPMGAGLAPGLYIQVLDGLIQVSNPSGAQNFAAGQFGFTPNMTAPPIILPQNPGLKFAPPPMFSTPSPTAGTPPPPKPNAVDCIVR